MDRLKRWEKVKRGTCLRNFAYVATALLLFVGVSNCKAQARSNDVLQLVDPRIGTSHEGQTYPVVGVPFGMTGWTPETRSTEGKCISPYYYNDPRITGFRGSHWLSGSCTQDYGTVSVMPTVGALKVDPDQRSSRFQHASEIMSPAYYAVHLDDYNVGVELAGATRAGILRVTFPESGERHLVIEPNAHPGQGFIEVRPDKHEVVGYNPVVRMYQGAGQPAGFSGYFAIQLQQSVTDFGSWCDESIHKRTKQEGTGCKRLGAYVTLPSSGARQTLIRIGTSFTSIEEAERNLSAEIPDWNFDTVRQHAETKWRNHLGRIEVAGGTATERTMFYTALFHASLAPRIVSDADGTYNGFAGEGKLHHAPAGTDYYDDFSLWDSFRALHPLLTILDPQRDGQMIQSLVDKGEQGGFLPIFPSWNSYTNEMIGDHAVPVIYDAYLKGIRNFDVPEAYRLVRQSAFIIPSPDEYLEGKGRRALKSYEQYGYIPLEDEILDAFHQREQVSRTLEYAYDDYVASQFAKDLGHSEDATRLLRRSNNWQNVFDPETRFVRGRHADGSWISPFDATKPAKFVTEANPWQYTFFVPHDIVGLIHAAGGREAFITKLDGLFDSNLYDQGNEPSHGIAYLYNFAGAPAKTQQRVRALMHTQFGPGPDGLPGNDDAGQMSAWFVLSAMGFYPECPGTLNYSIGSPLFSRIKLHLPSGKTFTINAPENSAEHIYVRSITLNNRPVTNWMFTHNDILNGATLNLHMEPQHLPSSIGQ